MAATGDDLLRALTKVLAADDDRGQVFTDVLMTPIRRDAAVLSMVAMSGERRLWAYAWSRMASAPAVHSIVEPRDRAQESALWAKVADELEHLLSLAAETSAWPQVLVPAGSVADFLAEASDRFRWYKDDARLRRLSRHAAFLVDARERGLPVLAVAPDLVTAHVATGQSMHDDAHLGAVLAWLEPRPGAAERATLAEQRPAGLLPDPDEDDERSELLARIADLERSGVPATDPRIRELAGRVTAGIEAQATATSRLVQQAVDLLQRQGLPPMPTQDAIEEECRGVFDAYWSRAGTGEEMKTARKEPMWLATQRMEDREGASSVLANALVRGSRVRRAILRKDGKVIVARVVRVDATVRKTSLRPGRPMRIHFTTDQPRARLRVGDSYGCLEIPNAMVTLREAESWLATSADGRRQAWTAEVRSGQMSLRFLDPGEELNLIPNTPDLREAWRWASYSGGARDWIYGKDAPPGDTARPPAVDVEAALDRMRRKR